MLREKIVAAASKRMVVIADASKHVARLGAFPLPIEVVPFGLGATRRHIESAAASLGCRGPIALRRARDERRRLRHRRRPLHPRLRLRRHCRPGSARRGAQRHTGRRRTRPVHWPRQRGHSGRFGRPRDFSAISPDLFIRSTGDFRRDLLIRPRSRPCLVAALFDDRAAPFCAYADDPTPAALESARAIIVGLGHAALVRSGGSANVRQLEHNVVKTRPELKDSLRATLHRAQARIRQIGAGSHR